MIDSKSSHEALENVLRAVQGEPLVILISGHPDPDAIGSAIAHQRICESLGVPATIAHVLPLSHRENRALVKLLHVEMQQITSRDDLTRFKFLSLADSHTHEPSVELPADLKLLTVVDHHRPLRPIQAPFVDLRPDLGATCTLYAGYLQHGLAPLSSDRREDARCATALVFGIQTDTDDFTLATPTDFLAAAYAKSYCDVDLLTRVGRRAIGAGAMDVLGRALANLTVVRDFAFTGVGLVPSTDRDAIATAADFILRREDIDTVVVYGIVDDRIDGSLRTSSPAIDPAAFLQSAFGKDRTGRPYGGGRADKGGFQIPLGVLAECEDTQSLWKIVQQVVRSSLAKVVPDLERALARGACGWPPLWFPPFAALRGGLRPDLPYSRGTLAGVPVSGVRSPAPGARRSADGVRDPTFGVRRPGPDVRRPASGTRRPASGVRDPTFGGRRPAVQRTPVSD